MSDKSEEYTRGYAQGMEDLAKRLEKYYNCIGDQTYPPLVAYTIEVLKKEMLEGIYEKEKG